MKVKIMFLNIICSIFLLSFSSCTIEGEEVCGIWNANGEYGEMQVEITPWQGQFLGYLLSYKSGDETIKGSKTEAFIFITDLEFKDGNYQNGKIYLDPSSKTACALKLELLDDNKLQATYDCDGQISKEMWYRKGFDAPQKTVQTPATNTTKNTTTASTSAKNEAATSAPAIANEAATANEKAVENKPKNTTPTSAPTIEGDTKKQAAFYLVGIQEVVKYDDFKAIEKAMERLWTSSYNDDFSGEQTILEADNVYVSYSNYDQPKGKMTITLGYKVKNLSNISSNLKGLKVPANEYLVYPMSGDKSDYEGEGWEQLGELMMYRKAESADFEVYTFDKNYEVTKAAMWIATE